MNLSVDRMTKQNKKPHKISLPVVASRKKKKETIPVPLHKQMNRSPLPHLKKKKRVKQNSGNYKKSVLFLKTVKRLVKMLM